MATTIPPQWLTDTSVSLDNWIIQCTIHNPPKVTPYFIERATQWIESDGKEATQDEINRRASALAWKSTNNIANGKPVKVKASEFIQATFKVDNLEETVNKSGRIEELGKQEVPMACLVSWLSKDEWEQYYPTPQDVGMNAKQYRSWSRHVSRVDKVQAMAFDFDGISEELMNEIFETFKEMTYIAYSSFSHKSEKKNGQCCIRIIVPFSRPVTPNEYNNTRLREGIWFQLRNVFPDQDEQTKDPTRLWYMPSYRADREEHFFTRTNEGMAFDVDAMLREIESVSAGIMALPLNAQSNATREATNTPPPNTRRVSNTEEIPLDGPVADPNEESDTQENQQRAMAHDTSFRREFVKGDWEVRCHDDILRPIRWVIENWETLPRQANGNYNLCRPGSHTVGSAFIHTHYDPLCELMRFRMTSVPSQTHWDCVETIHGITLSYDRRNETGTIFRPNQNRQNIAKMVKVLVDEGYVDIFSCARNHIGYVGSQRINDGYVFDIEEHIVERWYHGGINSKIVNAGVDGYVHQHKKDALVERLENLERVPGTDLETVFIRYLNVEDTPLHRIMSKKWFIGTVARAFHHGCQHDVVLIFSGNQGVGKTTFWKTIAGRCHYTGRPYHKEGKVDINNKDSLLNFLQAWIVEWGELSGMNHKSKEDFKLLTSQQENTIRKAYGHFEDDILRKGVIVGSCNPDQNPLVDDENRRIWLMHCTTGSGEFSYSRDDLAKEVDAIWAEAVHLYKEGIKGHDEWGNPIYKEDLWWLSTEERQAHMVVNEKMKDDDLHYNMFMDFIIKHPNDVMTADQIIENIYAEYYIDEKGFERKRLRVIKPPHKKEVSRILKKIGADYKTVRVDGHPCKRWVLPRILMDFETPCDIEITTEETTAEELKNKFSHIHLTKAQGGDWDDVGF